MPALIPLQRLEFPGDRYVSILMRVEILPGEFVARHTHPGLELTYVLDGEITIMVDGRPDRLLHAGDSFQVPAGVPHSMQTGISTAHAVATYVLEKDKPPLSWL